METTETTASKFCKECVEFTYGNCEGKNSSQERATFFGTHVAKIQPSGLNFCKRYEFDVRLYAFADGSGNAGTIKEIRKRQIKRDIQMVEEKIEVERQEAFDDVDLAESLSSADFGDLLI